jgi:hypothetical protein
MLCWPMCISRNRPHQYPFREPPQSSPKGKTTVDYIDLRQVLTEPLTAAHPDVLRELLSKFIQTSFGRNNPIMTLAVALHPQLR